MARAVRADVGARRMPIDDAVDALGVPSLRTSVLPAGTREFRMSDWYAWIPGTPLLVLRLVERPGLAAVGEWIRVWGERQGAATQDDAARCSEWKDGWRTSAAIVTGARTDWPAAAQEFDRLGVWTLRDRCEANGVSQTDSGELLLQRLAGDRFETYECNTPHLRTTSEPGRAALALYEFYQRLGRDAFGRQAR